MSCHKCHAVRELSRAFPLSRAPREYLSLLREAISHQFSYGLLRHCMIIGGDDPVTGCGLPPTPRRSVVSRTKIPFAIPQYGTAACVGKLGVKPPSCGIGGGCRHALSGTQPLGRAEPLICQAARRPAPALVQHEPP